MELSKAIINGDDAIVTSLCSEARNVNKRTGNGGFTPLHVACAVGNAEAVSLLLTHSADPSAADIKYGRTALHWALANRNFVCAQLLLEHGGQEDVADKESLTPFDALREHVEQQQGDEEEDEEFISELWTWGNGASYQLGHGSHENVKGPKKVKAVRGRVLAADISSFSAVVAQEEGTMSWGYEKLRLGQTDGDEVAMLPRRMLPLQGKRVIQVASSNYHTLVVTDHGELYSWGYGKDGKLGHDNEENSAQPRRVRGGGIEKEHCVKAAVSSRHSCCVTASGELFTFGHGLKGQLGHSVLTSSTKPKLVASLRGVTDVAASDTHTATVVRGKKETYLFGCGVATPSRLYVPNEAIVRVAAAKNATLFLAESGMLYQTEGVGQLAVSVLLNGARRRVKEIAASEESFAAIDTNGAIYAWQFVPAASGVSDAKATVWKELRGRAESLSIAKNSYCAIVHTPIISARRFTPPLISTIGVDLAALLPSSSISPDLPLPAGVSYLMSNFSDVVVRFEFGGTPPVSPPISFALHKVILWARSKLFRDDLDRNPDRAEIVVSLGAQYVCKGDHRRLLSVLVCYLYTDTFQFGAAPTQDQVSSLFYLARKLSLHNLQAKLKQLVEGGGKAARAEPEEEEEGWKREEQNDHRIPDVLGNDLARAFDESSDEFRFADIEIRLLDRTFRVHRGILCARSEYFRALLESGMIETRNRQIELGGDTSADTLRTLLQYLYTGRLVLAFLPSSEGSNAAELNQLIEILVAANQFLVGGLKEAVEVRLMAHLTLGNIAMLTEVAYMYEAPNLLTCCLSYLGKYLYFLPDLLRTFSSEILARMEEIAKGRVGKEEDEEEEDEDRDEKTRYLLAQLAPEGRRTEQEEEEDRDEEQEDQGKIQMDAADAAKLARKLRKQLVTIGHLSKKPAYERNAAEEAKVRRKEDITAQLARLAPLLIPVVPPAPEPLVGLVTTEEPVGPLEADTDVTQQLDAPSHTECPPPSSTSSSERAIAPLLLSPARSSSVPTPRHKKAEKQKKKQTPIDLAVATPVPPPAEPSTSPVKPSSPWKQAPAAGASIKSLQEIQREEAALAGAKGTQQQRQQTHPPETGTALSAFIRQPRATSSFSSSVSVPLSSAPPRPPPAAWAPSGPPSSSRPSIAEILAEEKRHRAEGSASESRARLVNSAPAAGVLTSSSPTASSPTPVLVPKAQTGKKYTKVELRASLPASPPKPTTWGTQPVPIASSGASSSSSSPPGAGGEATSVSPVKKSLLEIQNEERKKREEIQRIREPPKTSLRLIQEEELAKRDLKVEALVEVGFTEEEAKNGLEMFLGDLNAVVENLFYIVQARREEAAAVAAAASQGKQRGGGARRGGPSRKSSHGAGRGQAQSSVRHTGGAQAKRP